MSRMEGRGSWWVIVLALLAGCPQPQTPGETDAALTAIQDGDFGAAAALYGRRLAAYDGQATDCTAAWGKGLALLMHPIKSNAMHADSQAFRGEQAGAVFDTASVRDALGPNPIATSVALGTVGLPLAGWIVEALALDLPRRFLLPAADAFAAAAGAGCEFVLPRGLPVRTQVDPILEVRIGPRFQPAVAELLAGILYTVSGTMQVLGAHDWAASGQDLIDEISLDIEAVLAMAATAPVDVMRLGAVIPATQPRFLGLDHQGPTVLPQAAANLSAGMAHLATGVTAFFSADAVEPGAEDKYALVYVDGDDNGSLSPKDDIQLGVMEIEGRGPFVLLGRTVEENKPFSLLGPFQSVIWILVNDYYIDLVARHLGRWHDHFRGADSRLIPLASLNELAYGFELFPATVAVDPYGWLTAKEPVPMRRFYPSYGRESSTGVSGLADTAAPWVFVLEAEAGSDFRTGQTTSTFCTVCPEGPHFFWSRYRPAATTFVLASPEPVSTIADDCVGPAATDSFMPYAHWRTPGFAGFLRVDLAAVAGAPACAVTDAVEAYGGLADGPERGTLPAPSVYAVNKALAAWVGQLEELDLGNFGTGGN